MLQREFANKNFMLFVLACGIAAGVNFLSRIGLGVFMPYIPSIIIAYIFGIITAYILCRLFVFESDRNTPLKEMGYFTLVNILAIFITVVVSVMLADHILTFIHDQFIREEVAHFIGICAPVFTSYLGHKYFSFK